MTHACLSVVIPTIGRPRQLRECLGSLAACSPQPAEVVVVDQSGANEIQDVVRAFERRGVRSIVSDATGVAEANNLGLNCTEHELVAITHDDCTVSTDWIGIASKLMERDSQAIYTGSVLPAGDPAAVPSTIDDPHPHDYTGRIECRVLFPNNMVCARSEILALGGFDKRTASAEDNDFCYRWLRSGHRLLYEPAMRVWHHDWRDRKALSALHRNYGRSQGIFYAKHLRQGDMRMLRFIGEDLLHAARATASATARRNPARAAGTWQLMRGLPQGLRQGWREFGPREREGSR